MRISWKVSQLQTKSPLSLNMQPRLSNRTRFDSLNVKGITSVDDLAKWEDDGWDQCMSNCNNSDRITGPINAAKLIQ